MSFRNSLTASSICRSAANPAAADLESQSIAFDLQS